MSQSKVTSFYVTRRSARNQNRKIAPIDSTKNLVLEDVVKPNSQQAKDQKSKKAQEQVKAISKTKISSEIKVNKSNSHEAKPKTTKRGSKKTLPIDASQSKVTSFYEPQKAEKEPHLNSIEEDNVEGAFKKSECRLSYKTSCFCFSCKRTVSRDTEKIKNISEAKETNEKGKGLKISEQDNLRSPKRNLINPNEGTPPKKKTMLLNDDIASVRSPSKFMTPKKLFNDDKADNTSYEKTQIQKSVEQTPEKKEIVISNRSEETKKAIANFKAKLALARNYETNSFKATSIVSPTQRLEKKSALPTVPAYQRYSYLVDKEISSSLILPFKYKLLSEMFRSMDTVVSILNNRKEKITFEKVKEGVQQMMKRTFTKVHLGQIMTVMPSAYDVTLEKCTFKKANDPDYQLIITPKFHTDEDSNKKSKSNQTVIMSPQDLSERKQVFHHMLINLVKQHHQEFLSRQNFPSVPDDKIKRWHPKFAIDRVPDIEAAALPEIPENKIHTAKDVLNQVVKSSLRGKVVKALKSVAEKSANANKGIELGPSANEIKPSSTKSALKGVCSDLIAKIRARESAKLLETMIESPDEVKRKAMLERLPKIIQILWHYFIAERKAAVPIDVAIEKITHSFSSLSTHEEVKAHLHLITETFPGWLSFIQIPKGLYITINKNKNITEMLDNFQH